MNNEAKMIGLLTSVLMATACGPADNNTDADGPIDITDYDFTADQVLEDIGRRSKRKARSTTTPPMRWRSTRC